MAVNKVSIENTNDPMRISLKTSNPAKFIS